MKYKIGDKVAAYDFERHEGVILKPANADHSDNTYLVQIPEKAPLWFHEKQLRKLKPKVIQKTYIPVYPSQITQTTIEIVKNNRWYPNEENAMRWYITGEDAMKYTDDPREMITITRKRIKPLAKPVD